MYKDFFRIPRKSFLGAGMPVVSVVVVGGLGRLSSGRKFIVSIQNYLWQFESCRPFPFINSWNLTSSHPWVDTNYRAL